MTMTDEQKQQRREKMQARKAARMEKQAEDDKREKILLDMLLELMLEPELPAIQKAEAATMYAKITYPYRYH